VLFGWDKLNRRRFRLAADDGVSILPPVSCDVPGAFDGVDGVAFGEGEAVDIRRSNSGATQL